MKIKQIEGNSIFLTEDGRVYCIGKGIYGRLGLPDEQYDTLTLIPNLYNIVQIACGENHTLFLRSDGRVYGCGSNKDSQLGLSNRQYNTPTLIPNLSDIIQISCGGNHSFFLTKDSKVYGCGDNIDYQSGTYGDSIINLISDNIVSITSSLYYSILTTYDGVSYDIGDNEYRRAETVQDDIYPYTHTLYT